MSRREENIQLGNTHFERFLEKHNGDQYLRAYLLKVLAIQQSNRFTGDRALQRWSLLMVFWLNELFEGSFSISVPTKNSNSSQRNVEASGREVRRCLVSMACGCTFGTDKPIAGGVVDKLCRYYYTDKSAEDILSIFTENDRPNYKRGSENLVTYWNNLYDSFLPQGGFFFNPHTAAETLYYSLLNYNLTEKTTAEDLLTYIYNLCPDEEGWERIRTSGPIVLKNYSWKVPQPDTGASHGSSRRAVSSQAMSERVSFLEQSSQQTSTHRQKRKRSQDSEEALELQELRTEVAELRLRVDRQDIQIQKQNAALERLGSLYIALSNFFTNAGNAQAETEEEEEVEEQSEEDVDDADEE